MQKIYIFSPCRKRQAIACNHAGTCATANIRAMGE